MSNVIYAEGLTLSYENGRRVVIENANFKVKKGEFVFITGPSGSGKSTLLKSLYGALKPKEGTLIVGGKDMERIRKRDLQRLRRHLGIIFQDYRLVNEWTVEENILLPLSIAGFDRQRQQIQVKKLLRHVKLMEQGDRYPLELSGGEQQRVGVARALSHTPFLLLADEPTGNLDEYSSNVIWDLLENACEQLKSTVVVVTHKLPPFFNIPYRHFIIESKGIYEVR